MLPSVVCSVWESQYTGQQLSQDEMHDILRTGKRHQWAEQQGMRGKELDMSHGPFPAFGMFRGADYGAFNFGSASVERTIGAQQLAAALHFTGWIHCCLQFCITGTDMTPFIGRVNMWLVHTPPWVLRESNELEAQRQLIADVSCDPLHWIACSVQQNPPSTEPCSSGCLRVQASQLHVSKLTQGVCHPN